MLPILQLFLKGLPLHLYYEKVHQKRIYADCDLLIDKKKWKKTDLLLKKSGYQKLETAYSFFHEKLKDKETERVYRKDLNGFPVFFDVHLEASFLMQQLGRLDSLYPQELIDQMTKQFLKEKKLVKIQGEHFPILSPVNLIIYLSLHFFHHNFQGIFRLGFLHKVILRQAQDKYVNRVSPARRALLRGVRMYSSEVGVKLGTPRRWNEVKNRIIFYRLHNFIYPVFLMLKKYYCTPLSSKFLRSIAPQAKIRIFIKKNVLKTNIFDSETRIKAGVNRFKNLFFLSPTPVARKLLITFNLQVLYSIFWVMTLFTRKCLAKLFKQS